MSFFRFIFFYFFTLALFSFSYAVDWDLELKKLVNHREFAKSVATVSGALAEKSYNLATKGFPAGRLFSFSIQGVLLTGFLYISSEVLNDYISNKLKSSFSVSSIVGYNFEKQNVLPDYVCKVSFNIDYNRLSDYNSLVNYSFGFPSLVFLAGDYMPNNPYVSGYLYFCYSGGGFSRISLNGFFTSDFAQFISLSFPDCLNPSNPCSFVSKNYSSPLDVLNDPDNYTEVMNILSSSPVSFSTRELPSVPIPQTQPIEIHRSIPSGYTIVEVISPDGSSTFKVIKSDGSVFPANLVGDEIIFNDNGVEYAYNYKTDVLVNNTNNYIVSTPSNSLVRNPDGSTSEIDFGSFTPPSPIVVPDFDTSLDVPEKKSLTNLVNSSFSSIPVLNILKSLRIEGNSSICSFDVPFSLGGFSSSGKIDFCQFNDILNILGSFILAFAHLFAVYIVFKGD